MWFKMSDRRYNKGAILICCCFLLIEIYTGYLLYDVIFAEISKFPLNFINRYFLFYPPANYYIYNFNYHYDRVLVAFLFLLAELQISSY